MSSGPGFGQGGPGVSGRMGEQGGLRTGWLAAFGTEGYDGEPALLEELGVNFAHIQAKVSMLNYESVFTDPPDTHRPQSHGPDRPAHHGRQ